MMFVVKEEQLNLSSLLFFSLTMIRPSLTSSFLTAEQTAAVRSLHMKHTKINKAVQVFAGRTAVSSAATRDIKKSRSITNIFPRNWQQFSAAHILLQGPKPRLFLTLHTHYNQHCGEK